MFSSRNIIGLGRPGFTSSGLYIILSPWSKVSKSPGAQMPEGRRMYLLKLVPRILIQPCCSSTSYVLVRVSTYRNNGKRIVGWVTISHCYNFPSLHGLTNLYNQCPTEEHLCHFDVTNNAAVNSLADISFFTCRVYLLETFLLVKLHLPGNKIKIL